MAEKTIYLPVETLEKFIRDVLLALGVPGEDAQICTDVIIASDLRGIESHGIGRLRYYYDRIKSGQHQVVTQFEVVRESPPRPSWMAIMGWAWSLANAPCRWPSIKPEFTGWGRWRYAIHPILALPAITPLWQ